MRRIPSPATVLAVIAVIVAGAGSAVAATVITGKNIKNGSIGLNDLSKKAKKGLKGAKGAQGAQGPAGANGTNGTNGTDGAPGLNGTALAYAVVNASDGTPDFVPDKTKGFTEVYAGGAANIACLVVPNTLDITHSPRVATVWDNAQSFPASSHIRVNQLGAGGSACPTSTSDQTVEVRTASLKVTDPVGDDNAILDQDLSNQISFAIIVG